MFACVWAMHWTDFLAHEPVEPAARRADRKRRWTPIFENLQDKIPDEERKKYRQKLAKHNPSYIVNLMRQQRFKEATDKIRQAVASEGHVVLISLALAECAEREREIERSCSR